MAKDYRYLARLDLPALHAEREHAVQRQATIARLCIQMQAAGFQGDLIALAEAAHDVQQVGSELLARQLETRYALPVAA